MKKSVILITGINGEMGHGLIENIQKSTSKKIIGLDLGNIDHNIKHYMHESIKGSILDDEILHYINNKYHIDSEGNSDTQLGDGTTTAVYNLNQVVEALQKVGILK